MELVEIQDKLTQDTADDLKDSGLPSYFPLDDYSAENTTYSSRHRRKNCFIVSGYVGR